MPELVSDIVDVYVFRRLNGRVQFLLLQRRPDVPMPQTWQGFHAQIEDGESTLEAARRAVLQMVGLNVSAIYSADYVNQFFDDYRDVLVLAPVVAVKVSPQAPVALGPEFRDCAWFDRDEATTRLPFSGQRWAVRHIDELMSIGEREAELYRLEMPVRRRPETRSPAPAAAPAIEIQDTPFAVGEVYGEVPMPSDPVAADFPILGSASIFKSRPIEEPSPVTEPQSDSPPPVAAEDRERAVPEAGAETETFDSDGTDIVLDGKIVDSASTSLNISEDVDTEHAGVPPEVTNPAVTAREANRVSLPLDRLRLRRPDRLGKR
jgi:dATP pyrophosphohydrolase